MNLTLIDRVPDITPQDFREQYLRPRKPVILTLLSHQWPAYGKWTWDFFKELVGDVKVGVYNNIRAGAHVPVNGNDGEMRFGEYLDIIRKGPAELRLFLFNIFRHAPQLTQDFSFPDHLAKGFLKRFPMLFAGGEGSIAHMHYDIDLSHIFHTQFIGRKRILLLDNSQSPFIYKMPATVESAASFVNWHEGLDTAQFPALRYARAWHAVLEHGDTLFMPSGYWHHMQYMDSGFAMSLRALPGSLGEKLNGFYHIGPMRLFNNALIRLAPDWWYRHKRIVARANAEKAMARMLVNGSMA